MLEINPSSNQNLELSTLKQKIHDYAKNAFADNTLINYQSDWKLFTKWLLSLDLSIENIDYQTLILYITFLADNNYKASSIERKISAITKICELNGHKIDTDHKDFKLVLQGIRRKLGIAKKGKDPLLIGTIRLMLEATQDNPIGIRDKALLAFGWASAMRRSEITQLNWEDIRFVEEGVIITIKKSKTDKFSEGQKVALLYGRNKTTCPIINLLKWKELSNPEPQDPVFCSITKNGRATKVRLSDKDVARIVKKLARAIGLDDYAFAGHSLRSGIITTAAKNSVPPHVIMKHTRHKSIQMIQVYTRDNSLMEDNITGMVGL